MIVIDVHAAVLLLALGIFCLVRALRAFAIVREVAGRKARNVVDITPGRIEIHGTIHAIDGSAIRDATGTACVLVRTAVRSYRGAGRSTQDLGSQQETRVAQRVVFRDASGECEVDLRGAEIDGELRSGAFSASEARDNGGERVASLVDGEATGVSVSEATVRDGANVVITGDASELGLDAGDAGYRDARTRWLVASAGNAPLVLSVGSEASFLLRAAWPALLFAILALTAFAQTYLAVAAIRAQLS